MVPPTIPKKTGENSDSGIFVPHQFYIEDAQTIARGKLPEPIKQATV